jgi:hypothetical protein
LPPKYAIDLDLPEVPSEALRQDLESHASHFGLSEIINFLIKADMLENKEENERESW